MLLDTSVRKQTYIEDCEICCNPIEISVGFENNELLEFEARNIEQWEFLFLNKSNIKQIFKLD